MQSIVIYTTPSCPYCIRAKALLTRLKLPFEEIDVSQDDTLRALVIEKSGRKTVPQIFINDQSIGGSDELHALHQRGGLEQ